MSDQLYIKIFCRKTATANELRIGTIFIILIGNQNKRCTYWKNNQALMIASCLCPQSITLEDIKRLFNCANEYDSCCIYSSYAKMIYQLDSLLYTDLAQKLKYILSAEIKKQLAQMFNQASTDRLFALIPQNVIDAHIAQLLNDIVESQLLNNSIEYAAIKLLTSNASLFSQYII